MSGSGMRPRASALLLAATVAVAAPGCGGSGGGSGPPMIDPLTVSWTDSSPVPAADSIRLGGTASGTTVVVEVRIAGPTTSVDIYSFAFDVVLSNPNMVSYELGSETLGGALQLTGGQTGQVLVTQNGNRLIVGATKVGGGAGNAIAAGEQIVLSFRLRVLDQGVCTVSYGGAPPSGAPAVLDSAGNVIGSIQFDAAAARITAMR